ncbi:MAG: tetratricopeptide repeat protein, partial [Anaerolineales bacterium]
EAERPRVRKLIQELALIAERVPSSSDRCYTYQARLYAKLQEFEQALVALNHAIQLAPLDDTLVVLRGDIYQQANDYSQALREYTSVVDDHPEAVTARMNRAEVLRAVGSIEQALNDINEALKHEPRSPRLLYKRGLLLVELRRAREAAADFRQVAQLSASAELRKKAEQRLRELGEG